MNENVPMPDPLAFFITWPTYGTWLPGMSEVGLNTIMDGNYQVANWNNTVVPA